MDLLPSKVASALHLAPAPGQEKTDPTSLAAREKQLADARRSDPAHPPTRHELKATPQSEIRTDANKPMLAAEWRGARKIVATTRASPCVTDPGDVVVRVTSASVCGTDLHMYQHEVPGVTPNKTGDILGHECMGIIEDVGPAVTKVKPGDRVIVSAVLCCGNCDQCAAGRTSLCPKLNPSAELEKMMGARNAGLMGIGHANGAYSGGQAERVRVPLADQNVLRLGPEHAKLTDQDLLFLSDITCTAWHGLELAEVKEGQNICIWGGGPVGLMTAYLAKTLKKAARVAVVDGNQYRLDFAKRIGCETVNYRENSKVTDQLMEMFPLGADAGIDDAGFRFPRGLAHKAMRALRMETDSAEIFTEMCQVVRPGGHIALIGEYFGLANAFPIGMIMQKALTVRGGAVYLHKYWNYLLSKVADGTLNLRPFWTHRVDLKDVDAAYQLFDERGDNCLKIQIVTEFGKQQGNLGGDLPSTAEATASSSSSK